MFLAATDPNEMITLVASIKRKNSSRHGGITPVLIKDVQYEISYPFPILINKSKSNI